MSTEDHTKPPAGRDIVLLTLGVIGIGTSGPVIALSTMPVPSLIFWRNLGGALTMLPFALRLQQWKTIAQRRAISLSALAGLLLASHFICFFAAMRLTSVAAGVAITTMQPVFAAIYLRFKGGHIPRRAWVGMVIAFASVLLITGVDLQLSVRAFAGDLLALVGAGLSAGYVLVGSQAQKSLATSTYTTVCYFTCALSVLPVSLILGFELFNFSAREWWLVLALIGGAQLLGHTMFNLSLKRVSPAVVSLVVFFEVPVSALLAVWWMNQTPPSGTIPGIIGLLIGCGVFVFRGRLST
ncbi:MAG: EamA family transporter [Actinobacteria bacterium]|nr:EamA family transporter [Actinomycetota bacterium]MSW98324.1 EamA family transporter [Actinomycetota bacterium]MSY81947.1 EamA family transporter [Actinomycetota bacterium]MTA22451.1 EamA family transporter [Actinomycetota bacterium]